MKQTTRVGSADPLSTYYEYSSRNLEKTPKSMRDRGLFLDLPYSYGKQSIVQSVTKLARPNGQISTDWGTMSAVHLQLVRKYLVEPAFPPDTKVISKLAEKWRKTDLNIGMYLSPEGRESIEMMITSMMKLANCARQLKRGDFGGAMRNLNHLPRKARQRSFKKFSQGDLSGSFLAAHLGWEPLIKDIYTASNIDPPVESGLRIKASSLGVRGEADLVYAAFLPRPVPVTKSFIDIRRITYMGDIKRPPTFTERFGLGNAFSIAWELVPLSFVLDYFLPIGSVIDNMYFISQARFSGMWRKQYSRSVQEIFLPKGSPVVMYYGEMLVNNQDLRRCETVESFSRAPHKLSFADPLRGLSVTMPSSLMKLATMTSLLHQRLISLKTGKRK